MGFIQYCKTLVPFQLLLFYVFLTSGLIVNALQLMTLVIWPINKKLYRKLNIYLAYSFWINLTSFGRYWSGSKMDIYMDPEDFKLIAKEHAIVIMNHKYDIDWLMGWIVCQRTGLLSGNKIIGKASLRLIPLMGWSWLATESIFIKREWETDKKKLTEGLDKILVDYPDNWFCNVLMFCEGTRFTQAKHEVSMEVARKKNLGELKHHLLPRTKGFSMLVRGAAGRISAVYDLTIGIEEKDGIHPDLTNMRNGIPFNGELIVRRIPMSKVPKDDEGSAKFIYDLYKEKDEIFDTYKRTGSFKSLGVPLIDKPDNYYDFYLSIMWCFLLITPFLYYMWLFVIHASLYSKIGLFLTLFLATVAANLFISFSSSESGSKYDLCTNFSQMLSFAEFKKGVFPQLCLSYVFLVSGLFVNFLQLLTLIFIWPFSKNIYKRVNYYLATAIWGNITSLAQFWSGSDFSFYCSDKDWDKLGKEHVICVSNHHYDIDWVFAWVLCQRFNSLGGSKVCNKSSTKYLPIIGWSFWFNEMLFLKREWQSDKKSLEKELNALLETPDDLYFSISILCEGTRFTPEKHAASMEIAKEKGLPLLKHHLLPRTKGFSLIASQSAGKINWIYDVTIGIAKVNGEKPTLKHIKDGIPVKSEIYLRRIPISSVPVHNEKECADWLHKHYKEKDDIFDVYDKTGSFAETNEIKKRYITPNRHDLYVSLFWCIIILVPSFDYMINFLINGAWITKLLLIGFFMLINISVKYLISKSDTNKGSQFGLEPFKKIK